MVIVMCDECARGTFFGEVYAGAVIWDENKEIDPPFLVKTWDSKKISAKKRKVLSESGLCKRRVLGPTSRRHRQQSLRDDDERQRLDMEHREYDVQRTDTPRPPLQYSDTLKRLENLLPNLKEEREAIGR